MSPTLDVLYKAGSHSHAWRAWSDRQLALPHWTSLAGAALSPVAHSGPKRPLSPRCALPVLLVSLVHLVNVAND